MYVYIYIYSHRRSILSEMHLPLLFPYSHLGGWAGSHFGETGYPFWPKLFASWLGELKTGLPRYSWKDCRGPIGVGPASSYCGLAERQPKKTDNGGTFSPRPSYQRGRSIGDPSRGVTVPQ